MLKKIKIKTKLILPLSILVFIVLILSTILIYNQYKKSKSLTNLQNSIELATKISKFVHSTQKERGMTSGFLASHGIKFKKKLKKQREVTDNTIKSLTPYLTSTNNKNIVKALSDAFKNTKELTSLREKVNNFNINTQESIKFYSKMNDDFLNIVVEISKISKLPIITQNILAYNSFLYAKENVGIERALGTAILTKNDHNNTQRISFINLIAMEKLYTKIFFKYASKEAKEYYQNVYHGKSIDEVSKIIDIISYKNSTEKYNIEPEYWFKNITNKINKLKLIDNYLEKEILSNIKNELSQANNLFNGFAILNIISIFMFFLMAMLIAKILRSKQRLENLIDRYIISSTTDLKGKIIEVSDAFCNISGYTREELIGKPHNIIRHPDMPKSAFKDLWDTIQHGKTWDGEVKNLKKDGGYYWVYAHIEPLFNKRGNIEGYAAVRLDITDSVNLEEELVRSKEKDKTLLHQSKLAQMGEMISMIAHQWRQPLTAISSTSSDLYMKIMLDNYTKEYFNTKLEKIDELSQHLSSTIDDFRNFYKEDKQKKTTICSEIVKGALNIVSTSLEFKKITLKSDFKCQRKINVLINELRQVVLNLIKNAEDILIEKGVENPCIEIKTYDDEIYSYLEVIDNGGGIPNEIMEKIFDPYFSTKTKKDGTGLGLYMSKIIIEEHCDGLLLIQNTDDGAKFTIQIPTALEEIQNVS